MNYGNIWYGGYAYEGFARAFGYSLGVEVVIGDASKAKVKCAHVDSEGRLVLPAISGYRNYIGFLDCCATVIHEVAHVFYDSHKLMNAHAKTALEAACMNGVLDIADETHISAQCKRFGNPRAGRILNASLARASFEIVTAINGIIATTGVKIRPENDAAVQRPVDYLIGLVILCGRGVHTAQQLIDTASTLAKRACLQPLDFRSIALVSIQAGAKLNPNASADDRSELLVKCFKKLVELVKPWEAKATPRGSSQQGAPGNGSESQKTGSFHTHGGARSVEHLGYDQSEASEEVGEDLANGGAGSEGHEHGQVVASDSSQKLVAAPARKIADRIAIDGDGISRENGLQSGATVREPYRLMTDGLCMGRWNELPNADGVVVSIAVDLSGSMSGHASSVLGMAKAFSDAFERVAPVQRIVFGTCAYQVESFERSPMMGGTDTHLALELAQKFFESHPKGEKWLIIITDGESSSPGRTDAEAQKIMRSGGKILVIGINTHISMPATKTVVSRDENQIAMALGDIANGMHSNHD